MNIINGAQAYDEWMTYVSNMLAMHNVKGVAIVALIDEGGTFTGYWNMTLNDKLWAKEEINFDAIDEFLKNNAERYGFAVEDTDEEAQDE